MVGRLAQALGFIATAAVLTGAVARAWPNLDLAAPLVGELGPSSVAAAASGGKASRPVLLVVIDGLRADVAATLPFLSRLGDAGGRAATWDDPPTYSAAQYVALLAGVPPRDSGVRTNETLRAAGVDDVARRVRIAGMHTAVVSTCVDWWRRLFPESFESADVVASPAIVSEVARLQRRGGLVVVHLCGVDDAGHAHGARSPEYTAAAAAADGMTAALADAWGWPRADVVVTADHGHRDRGGHGGEEPEVRASFIVAAGPDVQPGARVDDARSVDLAPTLAALLGVAPPGAASGRVLVDLLRVPAADREALVAADAERQAHVSAAVAAGRVRVEAIERRARVIRAITVALLAALLVARLRPSLRAFFRGLFALTVTTATFIWLFGPPSFSAARRAFVWVGALSAIAFIATGLALGFGARRREGAPGAVATVVALALPALAALIWTGMFAPRLDCEPAWLAVGPAWAYTVLAAACCAAAVQGLIAVLMKSRRTPT
jgi:hypothetical protein